MTGAGDPPLPAGSVVWVVTQDSGLRRRWEPVLAAEGWTCVFLSGLAEFAGVVKASGAGAGAAAAALALIDADLAAQEGEKAFAEMRRARLRYVLFGRRERHDDAAVIRHLEAGADDFFDAAVAVSLLVAKLRAHLRRLAPSPAREELLWSPKRQLKLDPGRRTAWRRDSGAEWKELPRLTAMEFSLLALFLRHPGTALVRRVILEQVWGDPAADVNPETVDKHVESLRKKLGEAGGKIQTLYGVGYAFREE